MFTCQKNVCSNNEYSCCVKRSVMSRVVSLLLALSFFVTFGPMMQFLTGITAYAESNNQYKCGENLTWSFSNGTLTISGEGKMYGYFDGSDDDNTDDSPPWGTLLSGSGKSKITCIVEDGVTSIGNGAFSFCDNLDAITISNTVETIGADAFSFCKDLTRITIPESVTSIGEQAFYDCSSLASAVIPSSVQTIGVDVFSGCYNLTVYGHAESAIATYLEGNKDVIFIAEKAYTVTFPENVTVICESQQLSSGDDVYEGDELKITADAPDGYSLTSMTVNGKAFTSGTTYTVEDRDVDIKAEFEKIIEKRTVTIPEHVIVKNGQKTLSSGASVAEGDVLTITADVPDGYSLKSLTVNGKDFTSGARYTVSDKDIVIGVEITLIEEFIVTFPENITVTHTEIILNSGDAVFTGDVLWITTDVPDGYTLKSLTVNGKEFTSGAKYTVGSENVVIEAEFEEIAVIEEYTVTFSENVTVTRSSKQLKNGDTVLTGDKLTITADTPGGYTLKSLTVNGKEFTSGANYTVGNENVVIEAEFREIAVIKEYTVTFSENVTVTRSAKKLNSGDTVSNGDVLQITADVPAGYTLKSLTVNGKKFTSGTTFTVSDEDVVIKAEFEEIIAADDLTVTFPKNVMVTRTERKLNSGDTVSNGDVLRITADIPEGYSLKSLTVNGKNFTNGQAYIVGAEDVVIAVEFSEYVVDAVPISINIASMPYKITYLLNEKLELDGCYINVVFSDGSVENIPVTNDMVSGFDSSTVGTKRLMISCEGFIVSLEINVASDGNADIQDECVTSDGLTKGWKSISKIIPAHSNGSITVILNKDTIVPEYVIQTLAANNVSLTAVLNDTFVWKIDGDLIKEPYNQLDLSFSQMVYVPSYLIKDTGGIEGNKMHINSDNEYSGMISVNVGAEYSGQYANLMRYDEKKSKLEFISSSMIVNDGVAQLIPDTSGDYIIMIDSETKLVGDVNNDGMVDANDAADILRYIVGLIGLDKKTDPDMNEDSAVNARDAAYILKKQSDKEKHPLIII